MSDPEFGFRGAKYLGNEWSGSWKQKKYEN